MRPWEPGSARYFIVAFARQRGLSLTEVMQWHPRDFDTWVALDEEESEEGRFAQLRREHNEAMGRG